MTNLQTLLKEVKKFYTKEGRSHLPWRLSSSSRASAHGPYKILVSEVMLQQTQVDRVIPFYNRFIKKFPTPKALAKAKLSDVLREWQGLGYNRRAKFLWEASKKLAAAEFSKKGVGLPFISPFLGNSGQLSIEFLESLPGVGPYTARAISVFTYNRLEVFIETNIRTVFLHFFYSSILQKTRIVSDKEILPLVADALKKSKMQPRDFYAALMDYGTFLKKSGVKLNSRSKHYTKQSKFEGSRRQKRAALLRKLLAKGANEKELEKILQSK